jgi:hypothetical protein
LYYLLETSFINSLEEFSNLNSGCDNASVYNHIIQETYIQVIKQSEDLKKDFIFNYFKFIENKLCNLIKNKLPKLQNRVDENNKIIKNLKKKKGKKKGIVKKKFFDFYNEVIFFFFYFFLFIILKRN